MPRLPEELLLLDLVLAGARARTSMGLKTIGSDGAQDTEAADLERVLEVVHLLGDPLDGVHDGRRLQEPLEFVPEGREVHVAPWDMLPGGAVTGEPPRAIPGSGLAGGAPVVLGIPMSASFSFSRTAGTELLAARPGNFFATSR